MNKILIGGVITVVGFFTKLVVDTNKKWEAESEAAREESEALWKAAREENERKQKEWNAERIRILSKIVTSSNNSIKGYRILRHIRMVSITDEDDKTTAAA